MHNGKYQCHMVASYTYHLPSSLSCSTTAIQKQPLCWNSFWEKKSGKWTIVRGWKRNLISDLWGLSLYFFVTVYFLELCGVCRRCISKLGLQTAKISTTTKIERKSQAMTKKKEANCITSCDISVDAWIKINSCKLSWSNVCICMHHHRTGIVEDEWQEVPLKWSFIMV